MFWGERSCEGEDLPGECDPPVFRRGDCSSDGAVDIADAVCILSWLFLGGGTPDCVAVANANGDGAADISDATSLLSHLFLGGAAASEAVSTLRTWAARCGRTAGMRNTATGLSVASVDPDKLLFFESALAHLLPATA